MQILNENGRIRLLADDGKVVTDGKEIFGYDVTLAVGLGADGFYEITKEEYQKRLDELAKESVE